MHRVALLVLTIAAVSACDDDCYWMDTGDGSMSCGDSGPPPPQVRYDGAGIVASGSGYTIAYTRHEWRDENTDVPSRIELASLAGGKLAKVGEVQLDGAPLAADGAVLVADPRGPLLVWTDETDRMLHAGRLVDDVNVATSFTFGTAMPQRAQVAVSDTGFLIGWRVSVGTPLQLQRVDGSGAPVGELVAIDEPNVFIASDGTDYIATWIDYSHDPNLPATIVARRIPATGAPPEDIVAVSGQFVSWMSSIARASNGYRMFFSGDAGDGIGATWDVRIDSDGTVSAMRIDDQDRVALAEVGTVLDLGGSHLVVSAVGPINDQDIELRVIDESGAIVKGPAHLESQSQGIDVTAGDAGFGLLYEAPVDHAYAVRAAAVDTALAIQRPTTVAEDWVEGPLLDGCAAGRGNGSVVVALALLFVLRRARNKR